MTSSATILLLFSSAAMTAHCCSALIVLQAAISSMVRKHPEQLEPVSTQTLMQGDGGRSI
jgi:hypothetical protein